METIKCRKCDRFALARTQLCPGCGAELPVGKSRPRSTDTLAAATAVRSVPRSAEDMALEGYLASPAKSRKKQPGLVVKVLVALFVVGIVIQLLMH